MDGEALNYYVRSDIQTNYYGIVCCRFKNLDKFSDSSALYDLKEDNFYIDLRAAIDPNASIEIPPNQVAVIPTGLSLEVPAGFHVEIKSRSGLVLSKKICVLGAPLTVYSTYKEEIIVPLINFGDTTYKVLRGDRIAQLFVVPSYSIMK